MRKDEVDPRVPRWEWRLKGVKIDLHCSRSWREAHQEPGDLEGCLPQGNWTVRAALLKWLPCFPFYPGGSQGKKEGRQRMTRQRIVEKIKPVSGRGMEPNQEESGAAPVLSATGVKRWVRWCVVSEVSLRFWWRHLADCCRVQPSRRGCIFGWSQQCSGNSILLLIERQCHASQLCSESMRLSLNQKKDTAWNCSQLYIKAEHERNYHSLSKAFETTTISIQCVSLWIASLFWNLQVNNYRDQCHWEMINETALVWQAAMHCRKLF